MSIPIIINAFDNQASNNGKTFLSNIPSTCYIVGAKKAGKSSLLLNILTDKNAYYQKFNNIIFCSPTASLDEKIQKLREYDLLKVNIPLIKKINTDIIKNNKFILKNIALLGEQPNLQDLIDLGDIETKMQDDNFIQELTIDTLKSIIEHQKNIITKYNKSVADQVLIVLDDAICDDIIKSKEFRKCIFLSRHYKISVIFLSQNYYSLPKNLRLNNSQLLCFETGNIKEIESIYNENNVGISIKQFIELYDEIMNEPYSFINFNYNNDKKHRIINCFKNFLEY